MSNANSSVRFSSSTSSCSASGVSIHRQGVADSGAMGPSEGGGPRAIRCHCGNEVRLSLASSAAYGCAPSGPTWKGRSVSRVELLPPSSCARMKVLNDLQRGVCTGTGRSSCRPHPRNEAAVYCPRARGLVAAQSWTAGLYASPLTLFHSF